MKDNTIFSVWRTCVMWSLVILMSVPLSGCVSMEESLVTGRKRAYGYSWAQEVQIGQESDQAIVAQYGLYDDPQLAAYVTRLGEELLAVSHLRRPETPAEMKNTPFTFRVLDSPVVNAFALPGGFVYITRGILAHLDNEAQLAVVLGHEIGHVVGRHGSKRAASQQLGQLGVIVGAAVAQGVLGGTAGQDVLQQGGTGVGLLFLSWGRDDERESDRLGVEYSALTGYEAGEGSEFFRSLKRLSAQSGSSIPNFLSTHPDPGERELEINRMAANWEQQVPMDKLNRDQYLGLIDNMVVGEDPRQGYTEGNMFYHPTLKFQFPVPSGYQVVNQPTQVVLVEPNQKALIVFSIASDVSSAQDAGSKFAAQEGVSVLQQGSTSVNSLAAYDVLANATDQQSNEFQLISRHVEYGGNVYSFLSYSAKTDFDTYRSAFYSSLDGFRRLTDQNKINVSPTRLDIITTTRSGTFSSFLPNPLPRGFTAQDLAIINQVEVNDQIARGAKLKLPR